MDPATTTNAEQLNNRETFNTMKTSHELGRELLSGLDLPIYHFDPSRAGLDEERDTSLSNPTVEVNSPREGLTPGEVENIIADGGTLQNFITISGEQGSDGEAVDPDREVILGALNTLGTALADHGHQWTEGEREIYEHALRLLSR